MSEFQIPVAAVPPSQPATPPPPSAGSAARDVRHRALQCAIQYAQGVDGCTVADFWHYVAVFERYIGTGERGAA